MRHVMYDEERMRLLDNLQAVFTQEVFDRAYPGVPLPVSVSIGGDTANPPFEVIVRELPTGVTNTKLSTCADITSEFNIELDLVASGSTIIDCTRTLLVYCDVIHQVCMADPFFDGDVLSSAPSVTQAGTDNDGNFGYVAGMLIQIRMRRIWPRNKVVAKALLKARHEKE